jgi:hypothetical protein
MRGSLDQISPNHRPRAQPEKLPMGNGLPKIEFFNSIGHDQS